MPEIDDGNSQNNKTRRTFNRRDFHNMCQVKIDDTKAWRFGAVDYIIKPFSEKRLLASLESYKAYLINLKISIHLIRKNSIKCGNM